MSSNFEMKKKIVEEIKGKLEKSKSVILSDYRGLNVTETSELRKNFREAGVEYKVYKNNLVKLAVEGTEFAELAKDLVGPNAIAFGYDDPVVPAKVIKNFSKNNDKLTLKTGVIEGEYYEAAKMLEIAEIPSKDQLIVKFLGSIKSPVNNFVYLLNNISEKMESEEA
ncbi:50S ribosomal protein L10 [Clostridiaceae bacterium HSG29]|nr:50S ribosomal protein L10 [Clostridiaceae bacterium HSG29]